MLLNRRYRAVWTYSDPFVEAFDFLFLPGGTGCLWQVGEGYAGGATRLEWESTPTGLMDSFRYLDFEPTVRYQRRNWEAVTMTPGTLGDRYRVVENLIINNQFDPNHVFPDPSVTPGRMNSYEFIEDLTGQADPCGLGLPIPTVHYDEQVDGDINGEYGQGPVFELGVGTNTIAGVGNGPIPDPATTFFDFDIFSLVIPAGRSLVSIDLQDWGTQVPSSLWFRVRSGVQPPNSYEWTVAGGYNGATGQQSTPASIAADVAAIPLNVLEYTFNNSGSQIGQGVPYRWIFVVQ